ncbi:MAG TPA: hypothetical protein VFL41_06870 [Gaiellaceae bacterium]|nr:hypothetical protein [Gaiellaceae bacterium]
MKARRFLGLRRPAAVAVAIGVAAALVGGGAATSAEGRDTRAGGYRIVLGSNRDGNLRAYSVRPDGSRLTPLLPRNRAFTPVAISRDGTVVAYQGGDGGISVSRADGKGLRRLVRDSATRPALSPDGRLLAFSRGNRIWVVGTNGHGLRRLTSGRNDTEADWSPDGTTLAFSQIWFSQTGIFVQPLHGRRRLLVRGDVLRPKWSPNGRLIAYLRYSGASSPKNGLYVVGRDGKHSHRVARDALQFGWSPDGRRLVFSDAGIRSPARLGIVGVDGRGLRWLSLGASPSSEGMPLAWSPDARRLLFAGHSGDDPEQIWAVGTDGRGLQRVTSAGTNTLVGWTRLAPVLRPAAPLPPSERIAGADTVATRRPLVALSADGPRVAFIQRDTPTDCSHIAVWTPETKGLVRVTPGLAAPCREGGVGGMYGVVLAGSRVAWAEILGCGNSCDVSLESATLTVSEPAHLTEDFGAFQTGGPPLDYRLHGDGDLLVFNDIARSRLIRIGGGTENCGEGARICSTLRRGAHAALADSVSGELIAVRERDEVAVLDVQGALVRIFPFLPEEVRAARLDGGRLVVARLAFLDVYDVATGALALSRPLPAGFELEDVDGGIAVLRHAETIMLLRLADGSSRTLTPGRGPRFAELEPSGLYYSYAAGNEGRVVFLPRAQLF